MHGCGEHEKTSKKKSSFLTVTRAAHQKIIPLFLFAHGSLQKKKNSLQNEQLMQSDFFRESSTSAPPV